MAEEPFALSTVAPRSADESDYETICAAVMESGRGRWFLEEYARRNRQADTALVLAAINRLENLIQLERAGQGSFAFRTVLLEMARTISEARGQTGDLDPPEAPARRGNERSGSRAEIVASAERIHDVAWTMRERGMDPATCQEIETLASSLLTASSLQGASRSDDTRVNKLRDVLQYLEQRIQTMLDACAPKPAAAAGASTQKETDDEASPAETNVPSETLPAERAAADEQIPEPAVAAPGTPGSIASASSVGPRSGAETEHIARRVTGVPPGLEEHAEHAIMQSMAELELEPLVREAAQREEEELPELVLEVDFLVVEPLSQSSGSLQPAELSFSEGLMQSSPLFPPASESGPEQTDLAPPLIQRPLPYAAPDAADASEAVSLPQGAKETRPVRGELEFEAPAVELPSATVPAQVRGSDETTDTCADEKIPADLSLDRSEEPGSVLDQLCPDAADLDLPCEDASFDVTAAQNEIALDDNAAQTWPEEHICREPSRMELADIVTAPQTPSVSESSEGWDLVCSGAEKIADAAEGLADISPAVSAPESEMRPRDLTRPVTVDVSKQAQERDEASQSAGDTEVRPSVPQIEALTLHLERVFPTIPSDGPGAPAQEEDAAIQTDEKGLVETLVPAAIAWIAPHAECVDDETLPSEAASNDALEHDPEKWEPVFGKRACSNQGLERDHDSRKNHPALAQACPAGWDQPIPPLSREPESPQAVQFVAETTLESHTSPGANTGTIAPKDEDGPPFIPVDEPAVDTTAASIREDEVPVLLPDENSPFPAEALSFEEAVQPCDEMLVRNLADRPDVEQTANEPSAILADSVTAPEAAHAPDLPAQAAVSRVDEAHSQAKNEAQPEAASPEPTDLPFLVSQPTVELPAVALTAKVSEHKEDIGEEAVDVPTPPQLASTDIAHDELLSGAWEQAVSHPQAESAHQARLSRQNPADIKVNEALSATDPVAELPLVAPDLVGTAATSADTGLDAILEIEQELFAPAPTPVQSAKVPANEPPQARPIEELLPQPTLTEMSPARSTAAVPMETRPVPPPIVAPALQKPSVVPARPIVRSMPRPLPADPLAALRAMTDEERIALFS